MGYREIVLSDELKRRFFKFVVKKRGCWAWSGNITPAGYGMFTLPDKAKTKYLAHRVAYTLLVGPIPFGLTLDHLCKNRFCVNPKHLEPVTLAENTVRGSRKYRCCRGHVLRGKNLYKDRRQCRLCVIARNRELYTYRTKNGLCVKCGSVSKRGIMCMECANRINERRRNAWKSQR